ncbi:hypothetical protein J1N35_037735 [Gossypium stocksii]|uniref:Uncharacterized protein n=1 Tax=Gossypium stocksii TaxID=47602 RepID=A0A9D3ZL77_9ROSI|nr:hypothetical protein J1N35_037735 [Gossypium stocksii]
MQEITPLGIDYAHQFGIQVPNPLPNKYALFPPSDKTEGREEAVDDDDENEGDDDDGPFPT